MPRSRTFIRAVPFAGRINLVPMIDIVFQLLVFFMVASHLATAQHEPVKLPEPTHSQAREKQLDNRLTLNLISDPVSGRIVKIKANSNLVRDLPALVDLLLRYGPQLQTHNGTVIIRADKNLQFVEMQKVLQAVADAGVASVHIAARQDHDGGSAK